MGRGYRGSPRRVDDPRQRRHRGRPLHPAIHQPLHPRGERMIPDHLIDQAAAAIYAATVFGDEFAIDAWRDMADGNPIKITTRVYARAALEAVAADIWDHGYVAGVESAHEFFAGNTNADTPNPYRASENE